MRGLRLQPFHWRQRRGGRRRQRCRRGWWCVGRERWCRCRGWRTGSRWCRRSLRRHLLQGFEPFFWGRAWLTLVLSVKTPREKLFCPLVNAPQASLYGAGTSTIMRLLGGNSQALIRSLGCGWSGRLTTEQVDHCVGMKAGQQVEDDDRQPEAVVVLVPVGVVVLRFGCLECETSQIVGERPAGGGIGEPIGISVHHGDAVLPIDLNVFFVHVANDVTGGVNGAEP